MIANIQNPYRFGGAAPVGDSFIIEITTIGSSESFSFPFYNGGTYTDCVINFGDGGGDFTISSASDTNRTNIYAVADTYTITISGVSCGGVNVNNVAPYDLRFSNLIQWGTITGTMDLISFFGASNIIFTATDIPDFSSIVDVGVGMFRNCTTMTTIPNSGLWDVSSFTNFGNMFNGATNATPDCSSWDVSSGRIFQSMFRSTKFNSDISGWTFDTLLGIDMSFMFFSTGTNFSFDISGWDVSKVTLMNTMFNGCKGTAMTFSLDGWDVSNVTNMSNMFASSNYNLAFTTWDTSSCTNMSSMFENNDSFNKDLTVFDVSNVTNFSRMFFGMAVYNNAGVNLNGWDVSAGTNFTSMFSLNHAFNSDITGWTFKSTGTVTLNAMFNNSDGFNQNVGLWNVDRVNLFNNFMINSSGMATSTYDSILIGWDSQALNSGLTTNFNLTTYTANIVASGTTDGVSASKLIDSTQNFTTTVSVSDVIHNTNPAQSTHHKYALVTNVDSNTQLSLSVDIMLSGETYQVETSLSSKAKENIVNSDGWSPFIDGGGV